jgi:hypothetical protein
MIPKDEASSKPPKIAAIAGEGIPKIHRTVHWRSCANSRSFGHLTHPTMQTHQQASSS